MNSLNRAISESFKARGNLKEANKAYLEFIKANFIVPIEITSSEENPEVLFLNEGHRQFLPVFTQLEFLSNWADEIAHNIKLLRLSGVDLLKGIGEEVFVCLDLGTEFYKEFNPSEIARMRSMVLKFFKD